MKRYIAIATKILGDNIENYPEAKAKLDKIHELTFKTGAELLSSEVIALALVDVTVKAKEAPKEADQGDVEKKEE